MESNNDDDDFEPVKKEVTSWILPFFFFAFLFLYFRSLTNAHFDIQCFRGSMAKQKQAKKRKIKQKRWLTQFYLPPLPIFFPFFHSKWRNWIFTFSPHTHRPRKEKEKEKEKRKKKNQDQNQNILPRSAAKPEKMPRNGRKKKRKRQKLKARLVSFFSFLFFFLHSN